MIFRLSALWWRRIRGLWKLSDGRDWLLGKLVGSNILLSLVIQQKVVILEFSQEKMSTCPSIPHPFPSLEGSRHYLHYLTIVWSQVKQHGGNTALPINRKLDWDLLIMAPPTRTIPSFPQSQSLSSASFHRYLIYSSEGRHNANHNCIKLIKLITWTTALFNSMKLWAMPCRATQDRWVMVETSDKTWSTG